MDKQRLNKQLEPIYSSSVPIQNVAWKTFQEQWMTETGGERGSGKSVLAAHDGDDEPVFLSNTKNLHTVLWFQVFLSNTNNSYTYTFTFKLISWLTKVGGDSKAPFSIVTTLRSWGGYYSFPCIAPLTLDPYLIMLRVKQGGIKYLFFTLRYNLIWDWTPVSWPSVNTQTIMPMNQ